MLNELTTAPVPLPPMYDQSASSSPQSVAPNSQVVPLAASSFSSSSSPSSTLSGLLVPIASMAQQKVAPQHIDLLKSLVLDTIDKLKERKARPDAKRICQLMRRSHNVSTERTMEVLRMLKSTKAVFCVEYKGNISYRNPKSTPSPALTNHNNNNISKSQVSQTVVESSRTPTSLVSVMPRQTHAPLAANTSASKTLVSAIREHLLQKQSMANKIPEQQATPPPQLKAQQQQVPLPRATEEGWTFQLTDVNKMVPVPPIATPAPGTEFARLLDEEASRGAGLLKLQDGRYRILPSSQNLSPQGTTPPSATPQPASVGKGRRTRRVASANLPARQPPPIKPKIVTGKTPVPTTNNIISSTQTWRPSGNSVVNMKTNSMKPIQAISPNTSVSSAQLPVPPVSVAVVPLVPIRSKSSLGPSVVSTPNKAPLDLSTCSHSATSNGLNGLGDSSAPATHLTWTTISATCVPISSNSNISQNIPSGSHETGIFLAPNVENDSSAAASTSSLYFLNSNTSEHSSDQQATSNNFLQPTCWPPQVFTTTVATNASRDTGRQTENTTLAPSGLPLVMNLPSTTQNLPQLLLEPQQNNNLLALLQEPACKCAPCGTFVIEAVQEHLRCETCLHLFHVSCLGFTAAIVSSIRAVGTWQCAGCKCCCVCKMKMNPDGEMHDGMGVLHVCAKCDRAFHLPHCHSLGKPLPPGVWWACSWCQHQEEMARKTLESSGGSTQEVHGVLDLSTATTAATGSHHETCEASHWSRKRLSCSQLADVPQPPEKSSKPTPEPVKEIVPQLWTVKDVARWLCENGYSEKDAERFQQHEIDGLALLLLSRETVLSQLNLPLGRAVKIYEKIRQLQLSYLQNNAGGHSSIFEWQHGGPHHHLDNVITNNNANLFRV